MKSLLLISFCCVCFFPHPASCNEVQDRIEKPVEQAISIMQKSHKDEEEWRRLQEKLSAELELLEKRVNQLTTYRNDLKEQLMQTNRRIDAKRQQLVDVERIGQDLAPFLKQLMVKLETLPQTGLPFLQKERQKRMAKLQEIVENPEITVSEQYRKAMEALFIEAEFGVTIETYQEMLTIEDQKTLVNILRLGRLGLYFVTFDESRCGFYNIADGRWQTLSDSYIHPLQTAVSIAGKQRPAEFIDMPLGRIVR